MSIMVQTRKRTRKCHDGLSVFDVLLLLVSNDIISPIKESKKENHASCVMETVNHAPPCSVPNYTPQGAKFGWFTHHARNLGLITHDETPVPPCFTLC